MAERPSLKFDCKGISLAHEPDHMPPGLFPYLRNVRTNVKGEISARMGVTSIFDIGGGRAHSLRRVSNDVDSTSVLMAGIGSKLYRENTSIDTGYSGNPLSILPFRPNRSPSTHIYIGDQNKMRKVSMGGVVRGVGIDPPETAPQVRLDAPNFAMIAGLESGAWTEGGTAGANTYADRFNTTIAQIFYDQVGAGWCSILPTANQGFRTGAKVIIDTEVCRVAEVLEAVSTTKIAGILYDTGNTGWCSIALYDYSSNIAPNCIIDLDGEYVRVVDVVVGVDGLPSIRCITASTHAAGEVVTGHLSFRAYTFTVHANGDALASKYTTTTVATGVGTLTLATVQNRSIITPSGFGGRPVEGADYIHLSVLLDAPANFTDAKIMIDIGDGSFTQNYLYKSLSPADFSGADQWEEIVFKVSDMVRVGTDQTKSLATIAAIGVEVEASGTLEVGLAGWWIGGTYGPDVTAAQAAILYAYRYRDSRTGARSNLSPVIRTGVRPKRERVVVQLIESIDPQVDTIDLFRFGGGLNQFVVVGSFPNQFGDVFDSTQTNAVLANEVAAFDDYRPFPISDLPKAGRCNVSGVSVEWVSGDKFNTRWVPGSLIEINGSVYTLYGSPVSDVRLYLVESAGYASDVPFALSEPTIAGQPLPATWMYGGQGIGTFMFGVGDPYNPGFLRWCKGNDPDSASDTGNLEITSPSERLMNGCVYDSRNFVFSTDRLFAILPNFSGQGNQFVAQEVVSGAGLYSRWGFVVTPYGIAWIGKDGVYLWSGGIPKSLTDETLYPIFPHSGVEPVEAGGFFPPDYAQPGYLRLSFASNSLYFTYLDIHGNLECMRFDFAAGGWWPESYTKQPVYFYQKEGDVNEVILGTVDGSIQELTAPGIDNNAAIDCRVITPYFDLGDSRSNKYFPDAMLDFDIPTVDPTINFNEGAAVYYPPDLTSSSRTQGLISIALADGDDLKLYRNIQLDLQWTGEGKVYEFQPNAVIQPMLVTGLVTQYTDHGIAGFSHEKEAWVALISSADVTFTIYVDGVAKNYTIPSTGGKYGRVNIGLGPLKGSRWLYKMSSAQAFIPFPDQIIVLVKPWGSDSAFADFRPFKAVA